MLRHLFANLWLLVVTLLLCSVLYPLALWIVGQTLFHSKAEGSLVMGKDGKLVGSRLIGQPFSKDEYFQPRPSATSPSYNAAASGASNWAASNYKLRDRVARQLGPMVRYQKGDPVGPDVEKWFKDKPDIVAEWADKYPSSVGAWVDADDKHKAEISKWMEQQPLVVRAWKMEHPQGGDPKPADIAADFFKRNREKFHESWPKLIDDSTWSVQGVFFDMWLQEHPDVKLESVPADMVMASASGLDPHITLKNAQYQLPRVVQAWTEKIKANPETVKKAIEKILEEKKESPLGGLVGVPLVNVLEVNLALAEQMPRLAATAAR